MPIPSQNELHMPILEMLNGENGAAHLNSIEESLASRFYLSESERRETVPSGAPKFRNRMQWALAVLKRDRLILRQSRGRYEITSRGISSLAASAAERQNYPPENIKIEDASAADNDVAPAERMDALHLELERALADELLDSVKAVSPPRFERLVVELLEAMGYGEGRRIGGSGDQGIDGVINQDPLGLEKVYIQAKRWQNAVGEPEIRNFLGSLDVKGANKGVFITTSTFSESAKSSAFVTRRTIRLVDGGELAELMIRRNVGVVTETTYALKKPDENYFSEDA